MNPSPRDEKGDQWRRMGRRGGERRREGGSQPSLPHSGNLEIRPSHRDDREPKITGFKNNRVGGMMHDCGISRCPGRSSHLCDVIARCGMKAPSSLAHCHDFSPACRYGRIKGVTLSLAHSLCTPSQRINRHLRCDLALNGQRHPFLLPCRQLRRHYTLGSGQNRVSRAAL